MNDRLATKLILIYFKGLYIPANGCNLVESEDGAMITVKALCYGAITQLTGFTSGTDVEA